MENIQILLFFCSLESAEQKYFLGVLGNLFKATERSNDIQVRGKTLL